MISLSKDHDGLSGDSLIQDELQDIARSSYADMLNDVERNLSYQEAINLSVRALVSCSKYNKSGQDFFHCCDIGTGSGLLSMMVVSAFRSLNYDKFHVTAFEAFEPMAECAKSVIEANEMSDYITVIPTRSDQHKESPKFDLLVAELLDTELIGEGCLEIYRHAVTHLCTKECLFVPKRARIFIEPVASAQLFSRHHLDPRIDLDDKLTIELKLPSEMHHCNGISAIDDVQASALRPDIDFKRVAGPKVVFEFDFSDLDKLKLYESKECLFQLSQPVNEPIVLIMWWDISMYDNEISELNGVRQTKPIFDVLSCAPIWARDRNLLLRDQYVSEKFGANVWREHWIQGIYYLGDVQLTKQLKGNNLKIYCYHDNFSLWFDLSPSSQGPTRCTCGIHRRFSRSQLSFLSNHCDTFRQLLYASLSEDYGSLSISSHKLKGNIRFFDHENSLHDEDVRWKIDIMKEDNVIGVLIDLSLTTNHHIMWAPLIARLLRGQVIDPIERFEIKCTPVKIEDLSRILGPIGHCCGYDLDALDELIGISTGCVDKSVESHFMWEYLSERAGEDQLIVSSDQLRQECSNHGDDIDNFCLRLPGRKFHFISCADNDNDNGKELDKLALIFWIECKLRYNRSITSGYYEYSMSQSQDRQCNNTIQWVKDCKQVVHFLKGRPHRRRTLTSIMADATAITTPSTTTNNNDGNNENKYCFEYCLDINISLNDLVVYHRSNCDV